MSRSTLRTTHRQNRGTAVVSSNSFRLHCGSLKTIAVSHKNCCFPPDMCDECLWVERCSSVIEQCILSQLHTCLCLQRLKIKIINQWRGGMSGVSIYDAGGGAPPHPAEAMELAARHLDRMLSLDASTATLGDRLQGGGVLGGGGVSGLQVFLHGI